MTFQGIEYDLRDINDRMALSEKLLADLYCILTSDEIKAESMWAAIHGYSVPEDLSSRNGAAIALAFEFLQQVKSV